jgi:hypothetical protein
MPELTAISISTHFHGLALPLELISGKILI